MVCLATMIMGASMTFTSCSNDNNDEPGGGSLTVNPLKVFTGGMPKNIAGNTIEKDDKGRVKLIKSADETVTFEYSATTRATTPAPDVIMTVETKEEKNICNLYLNKDGFIERCQQATTYKRYKDEEPYTDNIKLSYDTDGHLVKAIIKNEEEDWNWIYKDGDITKVTKTDGDRNDKDTDTWLIYYTSPSTSSPMPNKGCVMIYETVIPSDFGALAYAYYAGMLGKATKHLPVRYVDKDAEDNNVDDYETNISWSLNTLGYPVSVVCKDKHETHTFSFTW